MNQEPCSSVSQADKVMVSPAGGMLKYPRKSGTGIYFQVE